MTYTEWVERVLGAAMDGYDEFHPHVATNLYQLAVTLGIMPPEPPTWNPQDPLLIAIWQAVRDLERLGLARFAYGGHAAIITHDGRNATRDGMRSLWPAIFERKLEERHVAALTTASRYAQVDHGGYATIQEVSNLELTQDLPWMAEYGLAATVRSELQDAGYDAGRMMVNTVTFCPTYSGIIRCTEREQDGLQRLVENLLRDWETSNVEFKRELHLRSNNSKAEFVRDILALATTKVSGPRYLVIGFDPKTQLFTTPVDPTVTSDRLEDILNANAPPPPGIRYRTAEWATGGRFGVIEVNRNPAHIPYRARRDLAGLLVKGGVWVRHGSHVEPPTERELDDLEAEGRAAVLASEE